MVHYMDVGLCMTIYVCACMFLHVHICYGLNVCVPMISYIEALTPQCDGN